MDSQESLTGKKKAKEASLSEMIKKYQISQGGRRKTITLSNSGRLGKLEGLQEIRRQSLAIVHQNCIRQL